MFSLQRTRYRIHGILALGICLLLASSFPPRTLQAATKQQEINNAIADFKDGQFQRASLANVVSSNPNDKVTDQVGGVQLGPIGLIKSWSRNNLFTLPKKLYSMGAVSIGSRIFIVGGRGRLTSDTVNNPQSEVWSVGVSTLDGALLDPGWQAEPALPAVQNAAKVGQLPTDSLIAPIESPAVTATSDASGLNGTIYVIGGSAASGILTFSSYAVRIGTVVNGRITGWQEQIGARLPGGVQQASAVTAQIGGVTYVYLVGGLRRALNSGGTTISTGLSSVYYARVGSGGKLYKPSSPSTEGWDLNPAGIPVSDPNTQGLWDASVVADNYVASTQATTNAIYVIGGQLTPQVQNQSVATYSTAVYRALIDNSNGSLSWGGTPGQVPSPRSQSAAVSFRGNLYMAGGVANGSSSTNPDGAMLTSYVEDDLSLHQFTNLPPGIDGEGTNFLQSNGTNGSGVLPQPRKLQGSVLVRAGANSPNSAFLFVLGGIGTPGDADTTDDNGANTIFYGKIGGGEDVSTLGYASNGWYYGLPFDVAQQFSQVQVQEIDWTTLITDTSLDVALEYRLSSSNNCTNATWSEWLQLDGDAATPGAAPFSVNGQNVATIVDPSSRCFQYRARLSTTNAFRTPLLLNVSVKVNIPGSPDLSPKTIAAQYSAKNAFLGLNVVIQNVNTVDPPTLAADIEKKGSFFVDLCIFAPGATVVAPTYPLTEQHAPACSTAYANINRSFMVANSNYTITQWLDSVTNKPKNLIEYFKQPGTYTVIVVADSFGYVDEGIKGGEANNISAPVPFTIDKIGYQLSLPVLHR